jgi:hypothetical protein
VLTRDTEHAEGVLSIVFSLERMENTMGSRPSGRKFGEFLLQTSFIRIFPSKILIKLFLCDLYTSAVKLPS